MSQIRDYLEEFETRIGGIADYVLITEVDWSETGNFKYWERIFGIYASYSYIFSRGSKMRALEKMAETASTLEEWQIVYRLATNNDDSKLQALAQEKINKLTKS